MYFNMTSMFEVVVYKVLYFLCHIILHILDQVENAPCATSQQVVLTSIGICKYVAYCRLCQVPTISA